MSIAVVGIGYWGKNLIREFSKISTVSHCITTGTKSNIDWLKKNFPKINHSTDFESVLKNPNVTSIIIATPIDTHFDLALKSLKFGKHVFVEKTLSENSSNALKLLKIAKQKKVCLFTGHIFYYHPIFKKIIDLHKDEKIEFMKFDWLKHENSNENIFLDLVSHDLFLILVLFGKPKLIKLLNSFKILDKIDVVLIQAKYSKQNCILHINRFYYEKSKVVSFKTKKGFYVWKDYCLFKLNKKTKQYRLYFKSDKSSLSLECREFMKIITKKPDYKNAQLSVNVLRLIETIK